MKDSKQPQVGSEAGHPTAMHNGRQNCNKNKNQVQKKNKLIFWLEKNSKNE